MMKVIDRTLRLTGRKVLIAAATYAAILLAHFLVDRVLRIQEPVLLLLATLGFAMWAISAAVYSFDSYMIAPGHGRRPPAR